MITKICFLVVSSLFIQLALGKPLADSTSNNDTIPEPFKTTDDYNKFIIDCAFDAAHVMRQLLNDESIKQDHSKQVEGFKKGLNYLLGVYEKDKRIEALFFVVEKYVQNTERYFELPTEETTPETELVLKALVKYDNRKLAAKFVKPFEYLNQKIDEFFEGISELIKEKQKADLKEAGKNNS